jgi:hypothetical protein
MDLVALKKHSLTRAIRAARRCPAEEEWLANITNLPWADRMSLLGARIWKDAAWRGQHSAQALGAFLALRLSLRTQRRHRQSGGRSETADGQWERRQHAGTRRRPSVHSNSEFRPFFRMSSVSAIE